MRRTRGNSVKKGGKSPRKQSPKAPTKEKNLITLKKQYLKGYQDPTKITELKLDEELFTGDVVRSLSREG